MYLSSVLTRRLVVHNCGVLQNPVSPFPPLVPLRALYLFQIRTVVLVESRLRCEIVHPSLSSPFSF